MSNYSYSQSGVDIIEGDNVVKAITPAVIATRRSGVMGAIGGFGALFDLKQTGYTDPILVAATDGVGTKLKIAIEMNEHDNIGQDLVAMCVNDLVVQGAEPLFFLDYYACGHLSSAAAATVINSIARACQMVNCALIGGETAEMPGLYSQQDYDLAGFAVGAVERGQILPRPDIAAGDILIGLASSGFHSNGFSLIRHVITSQSLSYHTPCPFAQQQNLGQALLTPTRLYVKSCLTAAKAGMVKGLAHITGGGITGNLPRIIPDGLICHLDANKWQLPPAIAWLARIGNISPQELARTFNCGIGMIAVVQPDKANDLLKLLHEYGEVASIIGVLKEQTRIDKVVIKGSGWGSATDWSVHA